MSWIDQGRQQHGWFGHGTAPPRQAPAREWRERAFAIVHFAAERFPGRDGWSFPLEKTTGVLRTLAPLMAPWSDLPPNAFRERFFRDAFDPVDAWHFQLFMRDVAEADDHAALMNAGQALAATIRSYGPQGWPSLLGRAIKNFSMARDDAPGAASGPVQQVQLPLRGPLPLPLPPVFVPGGRENEEYFVKPVIRLGRGIGDAVGGLFRSEPPGEGQPAPGGTSPDAGRDGPETGPGQVPGYAQPVRNAEERDLAGAMLADGKSAAQIDAALDELRKQQGRPGRIDLPANPDDLLQQGWKETSHPDAASKGHRTFENPSTGEKLRFDKGKPGENGFEGQDHYHRLNPSSTSRRNDYLDRQGNEVPRGSNSSHIIPGGSGV